MDTNDQAENHYQEKHLEHGMIMVNTVKENKNKYSARDIQRAKLAKKVQDMIRRPSTQQYMSIIVNNLLPNCNVTANDIKMAEDIFEPNLGSLKGKMTRRKTVHVEAYDPLPILITIMDKYHNITLAMDIMFINNNSFFTSISPHIGFGTAEKLANRQSDNLRKDIIGICKVYALQGFKITMVLGDNEFEVLRGELSQIQIQLNTAAADEHVPEIERYNRTIKERCCSIYNTLPYKKIPHIMLAHMVYFSVFWLNSLPPKGGIATHVSPRTIITGLTINFSLHCQLEFGSYVQTHEAHNNNMNPRTIGAICLGPKGNIQGGYNFMSLSTGERIHRRQWTPLPMPEEVIERVHKLAQRAPYGLTFDNDDRDISEVDGDSTNGDDGDDYEHMNPFNFNNNQNISESDGEDDQLPANQVDSEMDFEFNEDHLDNQF
jgi:hypothetical protein